MRKPRGPQIGFSITELLVGALVVTAIGTATYKVLKSNVQVQLSEIRAGSQNKQAIVALNQLEADLRSANPVWARQGVSAFFPHQGLGPADGSNPLDSCLASGNCDVTNDAITFLTVNLANRQLFLPANLQNISWKNHILTPASISVEAAPGGGLKAGDLVLIYQSHQWALVRLAENPGTSLATSYLAKASGSPAKRWKESDGPRLPVDWLLNSAYAAKAVVPTRVPTRAPTQPPPPTPRPTRAPTVAPTRAPTVAPTRAPTVAPTRVPTVAPTRAPTRVPTRPPAPRRTSTPVPTRTSDPCLGGENDACFCTYNKDGVPSCFLPTPRPTRTPRPPAPATPVPSPTPTPAPTATPVPPTATPRPTSTPGPTAVPTQVPIPVVTSLKLSQLPESLFQKLKTSSGNIASGYSAVRPGPPEASFDTGRPQWYDSDPGNDNEATFYFKTTTIEPVQVVTYRVRYVTQAGAITSSATPNADVVRDSLGNPQLFLTRESCSNYVSDQVNDKKISVLLPVDSFRLSYDLIQTADVKGSVVTHALWGGTDTGRLFTNVGRTYTKNASVQDPLDLGLYFGLNQENSSLSPGAGFAANMYKITAVSPHIATIDPSGKTRDYATKVMVSSAMMKLRYQEGQTSVSVTEDLGADETGAPISIDYGNGVLDLVIPASHFEFSGTPHSGSNVLPEQGVGKLLIRNEHGGTLGSEIRFNPGIAGAEASAFYPTNLTLKPGDPPSGMVVGGMLVKKTSGTLSRVPALAIVEFGTKRTMRKVAEGVLNCGTTTTLSSSGGCTIQAVPVPTLPAPNEGVPAMYDTSGGMTLKGNTLFVASMTKKVSRDPLAVLKATWNSQNKNFENFGLAWEVDGTGTDGDATNQMITSMFPKPLTWGSRSVLGICVGNRNDGVSGHGVSGPQDLTFSGAVRLRELLPDNTLGTEQTIAYHNSPFCRGLDAVGDNVVVSGRLVGQVVPPEYLYAYLQSSLNPSAIPTIVSPDPINLELDEIVGFYENPHNHRRSARYADGFQVDPASIESASAKAWQYIGGLTGTGVFALDGLNFDFSLANRARYNNGSPYRDASLIRVSIGGYLSQVLASIEKKSETNPNLATVHARFVSSTRSQDSSLLPPGGFLGEGETPWTRENLPTTYLPGLTDRDWFNNWAETVVPNGRDHGPFDELPPQPSPLPTGTPGGCSCADGCFLPSYPDPLSNGEGCTVTPPPDTSTPTPRGGRDSCLPGEDVECKGGRSPTTPSPPSPTTPPRWTCPPEDNCAH